MVPTQSSTALAGLHQNLAPEPTGPEMGNTLHYLARQDHSKRGLEHSHSASTEVSWLITAQPSQAVDLWRMNDRFLSCCCTVDQREAKAGKGKENRKHLKFSQLLKVQACGGDGDHGGRQSSLAGCSQKRVDLLK